MVPESSIGLKEQQLPDAETLYQLHADGGSLLDHVYRSSTRFGSSSAVERDETLSRALDELIILSELAFEIGSSSDSREIADTVLRQAVKAVDAEQGAIMLVDEEDPDVMQALIRVNAGDTPTGTLDKQLREWMLRHKTPFRLPSVQPLPGLDGHSLPDSIHNMLCIPLMVRSDLKGVLTVFNKRFRIGFTDADERLLAIMTSQSAQVIENARLQEKEKQLQHVREELALAHKIQLNLLPKRSPNVDGYDIAGISLPAHSVGGDYFDYLPIAEHLFGFCVGDVSGKGLPAALVMANVQATVRGQAYGSHSLASCLDRSNVLIYESAPRGTFVTLWCGLLDTRRHLITYANAGHNRPFLLRAGGQLKQLGKGDLVLGAVADQTYKERAFSIRPGDTLLLYSDGVTEALSSKREMFGEDRLASSLRDCVDRGSSETVETIVKTVRRHAGDAPQSDDMTLLVVKRLN